jgi:hypothetical protein
VVLTQAELPKCWKDACLVFSFDVGKPNNDKVTPEKPWYCSACHVTLADDEMPLDVELELYAHLEELAHFLESMSSMDSVNRADAWTSLLADMQMVNKHSVFIAIVSNTRPAVFVSFKHVKKASIWANLSSQYGTRLSISNG